MNHKPIHEDTLQFKNLRKNLVDKLRYKGIENEELLDAINRVLRHAFMNEKLIDFSYVDNAFPIGEGQTVSQPFTVAFQTQLLEIKKDEKVLEVGTGSGYQSAVLSELGAVVYTIERNYKLFENARRLLFALGYHPFCFYGDGYEGLPEHGPFDKIIITAAATEIPPKLLEQLKSGGKLVMPLGGAHRTQQMTLVDKMAEHKFKYTDHGDFIFVPLKKGIS
jgi:protein-L-isoaspartate(D-aspartate) O-methyltransferase